MATQGAYQWNVPLETDKPAGARQMRDLARDIEGTVTALQKSARTQRAADVTGAGGSRVPIVETPPRITAAPAGIYQVTCTAVVKNAAATDIYGVFQVIWTATGTAPRSLILEGQNRLWQLWTVSDVITHTGGDLQVLFEATFSPPAGMTVRAGSFVTIARVG